MGQAKQRGSYEERKAAAIDRELDVELAERANSQAINITTVGTKSERHRARTALASALGLLSIRIDDDS